MKYIHGYTEKENLQLIQLANTELVYCSLVNLVEGEWVDWGVGGMVILASYEFHFIRIHENMMQHPSNNISVVVAPLKWNGHTHK